MSKPEDIIQEASADGWHPIETVPYGKLVDLWCIPQDIEFAEWSEGGTPVGEIISRRHKHENYGWFGNQSDDFVPQAGGPDIVPVAWRPATPNCPVDLIAAAIRNRTVTQETT